MNQLFSTIRTGNSILDRIQANISNAFNQIFVPSIFFGGVFIPSTALIAGQDNVINHGLGRSPRVWILCDLTGTSGPVLTMNSYTPAGTITNGTPDTFAGTAHVLTGSVSSPVVWRTAWSVTTLTLRCGLACTVGIWVN